MALILIQKGISFFSFSLSDLGKHTDIFYPDIPVGKVPQVAVQVENGTLLGGTIHLDY